MRISDWSSDVCSSDLITAMKIAEQRRQIGTTMTHVSRIVEELVERLEGASRRVVPGAEPGGGARKLLDATRSLLDDLTPVAQRQDLSPAPAMVDSLLNEGVDRKSVA